MPWMGIDGFPIYGPLTDDSVLGECNGVGITEGSGAVVGVTAKNLWIATGTVLVTTLLVL
jgi:hypothetical protein